MANEVEHFFLCLLATCISSLEDYLVRSLLIVKHVFIFQIVFARPLKEKKIAFPGPFQSYITEIYFKLKYKEPRTIIFLRY